MPIQKTEKIWYNGKFINWDQANIHVMSHVVHYGSSVFEGVRCYAPKGTPAIFRAQEHMQRMLDSAKIYRIDVDYSVDELVAAMADVVKTNGVWPCYIRPIVLRGYGELGVNAANCPVEVYIANYRLGQIPASPIERWSGCVRFVLDAAGSEYAARDGEGRRQLHELPADQDGGHGEWLRGRDCAG